MNSRRGESELKGDEGGDKSSRENGLGNDDSDEDDSDDDEEDEDEEGSEGSGSSSDEEDEEGEEDSGDSTGSSDESSDEETFYQFAEMNEEMDGGEALESCPICMLPFKEQRLGTPDVCDHFFCLECIRQWSLNVNTCPLDRQVFRMILARRSQTGEVYKKIPVEDRQLVVNEDIEPEDNTVCEECGLGDREDRLLLCDDCNRGFHLDCLNPPLNRVPHGDWFCPDCSRNHIGHDLLDVVEPQGAPRRRQAIARTVVAERVRNAVVRNRINRRQVILSDSETDEQNLPVASTSSRAKKRPKKRGRKRKTKKRKVSNQSKKIKSTSTSRKSSGSARKGKRRKKKRKGKKMSSMRKLLALKAARTKGALLSMMTVKTRLAHRLGITSPPVGQQIPRLSKASSSQGKGGYDCIATPLSVFGNRNDLDPFLPKTGDDSNIDAAHVADGGLSAGRSQPSTSAARSTAPMFRDSKPSTSAVNLLGDILEGQKRLLLKPEQVFIDKDGSLKPNPTGEQLRANSRLKETKSFPSCASDRKLLGESTITDGQFSSEGNTLSRKTREIDASFARPLRDKSATISCPTVADTTRNAVSYTEKPDLGLMSSSSAKSVFDDRTAASSVDLSGTIGSSDPRSSSQHDSKKPGQNFDEGRGIDDDNPRANRDFHSSSVAGKALNCSAVDDRIAFDEMEGVKENKTVSENMSTSKSIAVSCGKLNNSSECDSETEGFNKDHQSNGRNLLEKGQRMDCAVLKVKQILKPYFIKNQITKDEYKDIMRRTVPKICQSKSEKLDLSKIETFVKKYVLKVISERNYR